jgi:hypothetical protein
MRRTAWPSKLCELSHGQPYLLIFPPFQTKYNAPGAGSDDALARTRREVDDLKGIMVENVEKVLKRGEHLDLLVDRAEDLQFEVRRRRLIYRFMTLYFAL